MLKQVFTMADLTASNRFGRLLGENSGSGEVICLNGGLGAGKTTLTQAIACGLEVSPEQYVTSPTFALMHEYSGRIPLYHLDLYRLGDEIEVENAGLHEYLESDGLAVVEWSDRLGCLAPRDRLDIDIEVTGGEGRRMLLSARGTGWALERLRVLERCWETQET